MLEQILESREINVNEYRQETLIPLQEKLLELLGDVLSASQLDMVLKNVQDQQRSDIAEMIGHNLPDLSEKNSKHLIEAFLSELNLEFADMRQLVKQTVSKQERLYRIQVFADNVRARLSGSISDDQRIMVEEFLDEYVANFEILFDQEE